MSYFTSRSATATPEKPYNYNPERFPGMSAPEGETFEQGLARLATWPETCRPDLRFWKEAVEKGWAAYFDGHGPKRNTLATPQTYTVADIYFKKGDMTLWRVREGWRVCTEVRGHVCGHQTFDTFRAGLDAAYSAEQIAHFEALEDKKTAIEEAMEGVLWDLHGEWLRGCALNREINAINEELLGRVPSTMAIVG